MKLEVGMYVRNKPLLSSNYVKINKIKEIEEKENCLHIWLEDKDLITEKYIIKASHNIIDLIEVGDYVNGKKVYSLGLAIGILNTINFEDGTFMVAEDIKSIVTKEAFKSMEYRLGDK